MLQAIIEGLGIFVGRLASPPPPGVPQGMGMPGPVPIEPAATAASTSSSGGWFDFLSGGGEVPEGPTPTPVTEVHHISDDVFQPPPMPTEFSSQGDGKH